jgi:hypothetical protein
MGFGAGYVTISTAPTSIITPHSFEKRNFEHRQYHDSTNLPFMVLLLFALQRAGNTMKNTIDDADYIIDWIALIIIFQCVKNSGHSHSIVNKPFISFIFIDLFSC